jgi:hypothetical protein
MTKQQEQAEADVRKIKLEALQRDINLRLEQLPNVEYIEYNDETWPGKLEKIKEQWLCNKLLLLKLR